MNWFVLTVTAVLTALLVAGLMAFLVRAALLNWVVDRTVVRLLKEPYSKNLWDVVIGLTRIPPHIIMELELRADYGKLMERPLGTIRLLPDFAGVAFNPAQVIRLPLGPTAPIDLKTLIGPKSQRPLRLTMPMLISGMGYGVSLSKPFVLALARGASRVGTAYNAGSGPVLDEVLDETRHLILQYTGGAWNQDPEILAQADMVEIRYGHGARAALGRLIPIEELPPEAQQLMGLPADAQYALHEAPLPGATTLAELQDLVARLRNLIDGGPIGVKLAATHDLERELEMVLQAGVDVVSIDGAQGGTHGAPPIVADDFGIPTIHALHRAVQFLERTGARKDVSLVISGGIRTPGEILKAMALGADAVALGTVAMMAGTHGQISKSIPFEPVTQICWANGGLADTFDSEKGAETVANFLQACAEELAEAARALGKRSIHEINRDDLVARDRETASYLHLPPTWIAPAQEKQARQAAENKQAWHPPQEKQAWHPPEGTSRSPLRPKSPPHSS